MFHDVSDKCQHQEEMNKAINEAVVEDWQLCFHAWAWGPDEPQAPSFSLDSENVDERNVSPQCELPDASTIFTSANSPTDSQSQSQFEFDFRASAERTGAINPYSSYPHHPVPHSISPMQLNLQSAGWSFVDPVPSLPTYMAASGAEKQLSIQDELKLLKMANEAPDPRFHRPNKVDAEATRKYIAELERKAEILQYNLDIKLEAKDGVVAELNAEYTRVHTENLKIYLDHRQKVLEESLLDTRDVKEGLAAVMSELGKRNAMLSPIRKLGADELFYIFEACISSADVENGEDSLAHMLPKAPKAEGGTPRGWRVFDLMQVCSLWRRHLLNMPSAWKDISLFPPCIGLTESDYAQRLDAYCRRVGALSVNVTIRPLYLSNANAANAPRPRLSLEAIDTISARLLLRLMRHIPINRWKTLRILYAAKFPFSRLIQNLIADTTDTDPSASEDKAEGNPKDNKEDKNISNKKHDTNDTKDKSIIKPTFSKLHSLLIMDPPANSSPFFDLVANTSENLEHLQILTNPLDRNDSNFLKTYTKFGDKLLTLRTILPHVQPGRLHLPATLTTLELNFLPHRQIVLPQVRKLELLQSCDLLRLRDFQLPNLTHLKCKSLYYSEPGPGVERIHMPSLVSLIVTGSLSPGLEVLSAPNLEELYIERSEGSSKENKWKTIKFLGTSSNSDDTTNSNTSSNDVNNGSWASLSASHNIRPTRLTLNVVLSTEQILRVFHANPQLTHLAVVLDKHVKWRRKLKDVLCQVKRAADVIVAGDNDGDAKPSESDPTGEKPKAANGTGGPGGPSGNTRRKKHANQGKEDEKDDSVCVPNDERTKRKLEVCPLLQALTFSLDFGDTKETKEVKTASGTDEEVYGLDTWKAVTTAIIRTRSIYGPPLTITCKWKDGKSMVYGAKEKGANADGSKDEDGYASIAPSGRSNGGDEYNSDDD